MDPEDRSHEAKEHGFYDNRELSRDRMDSYEIIEEREE